MAAAIGEAASDLGIHEHAVAVHRLDHHLDALDEAARAEA